MSRLFFVALATVSLGACGSDSPTKPASPSGTFSLSEIAGTPLPVTTPAVTGDPVQINSASITFNHDGTFLGKIDISEVVNGVTVPSTITLAGQYAVTAGHVTITDSATGTMLTGTWDVNQPIVFAWNGVPFLFIHD
jgi:hypothetical protein